MESDKPVVSDEQIKSFFQAFRNKFGVSLQAGWPITDKVNKFVRENLNDGNSMEYHLMETWGFLNDTLMNM